MKTNAQSSQHKYAERNCHKHDETLQNWSHLQMFKVKCSESVPCLHRDEKKRKEEERKKKEVQTFYLH